jgi:hypothetical protein
MIRLRSAVLPLFALALAARVPAFAQSVVSTHSGVLYFFEGSVFVGDKQLEQKFGKFPNVDEGGELRTETGRAEVLLTPGVFLRIGENSAIRMLSNQLSDTRVELLRGSAILEANPEAKDTKVTLFYKNWQIRVPREGVCRIDAEPPQVQTYKGEVEVSVQGKTDVVTVKEDETLPLAAVLVPRKSAEAGGDGLKNWAMTRSQAVSADNAVSAEITDDPTQIDASSGLANGGITYFPLGGIPALGMTSPYGISFWSPYQSALSSLYFPPYMYGLLFPRWPSPVRFYPIYGGRPVIFPGGIGTRPRPIGVVLPGRTYTVPPRTYSRPLTAPPVIIHTIPHR